MRFRSIIKSIAPTSLLMGLLLTASTSLHAASLNLLVSFPDFVLANSQAITFTAVGGGGGTLTVTSTNGISTYTENPSNPSRSLMPVAGGSETFSFTAVLDQFGNVITSSSSFKLDGRVLTNNNPGPAGQLVYDGNANINGLLSGTPDLFGITNFSITDTGVVRGTLEFTFMNASGVIATSTPYGTFTNGGILFHLDSSTICSTCFSSTEALLAQSWTATAYGDVFVPIPAAVWLFGSGLLAIAGMARNSKKAQA